MLQPSPKILIVDNTPNNLVALRRLLRKADCEVIAAGSGNEALALCLEHDFAVVLLDIDMPEMDGYEVVGYLKDEVATRHIPVIFVTASFEDQAHQMRGYEVGAVDYILKPIDDFILLAKVNVFLELYKSRSQLQRVLQRSETMRTAASVSEARLREALSDAPVPVLLHAQGGEILRISRVGAELSGCTQRDIRTMREWVAKAVNTASRQSALDYFEQLYTASSWVADFECELLAPDGSSLIWDFHSGPLAPLPDGRRLMISMALDVTERKKVEQALIVESRKSAMLLRSASDAIHILDLGGRFMQVNDAFCRLVGYSRDVLLGMNWSRLNADLTSELVAARLNAINEAGELIETRFKHADGHLVEVEIHAGRVEMDKSSVIYAAARDITERREREEAQRLALTVFNTVGDAVVVTDAKNRVVSINPAFSAITGYSADEMIGRDPNLLASGKQAPEFYQQLWSDLSAHGAWQGEVWNRRKDGTDYLESLAIKCIFNERGQIQHYVGVFSDITNKKLSEELIWRQANFDSLTQLPNRRMFRDRLEQEVKKAGRSKQPMALLFIDLDHFKEVNDTLGHDMGDVLLVEGAQRIVRCVRATDTVARLGGDEFTVLLTELDDTGIIERVATEIVRRLAEPFLLGLEKVYVSASIGIALYPSDAREVEDLLKSADQAMYAAKEAGRGRHEFYSARLQEEAQQRKCLLTELRDALAASQFRLYYQPIVDLRSGRIEKTEALIRWQHPTRGLVGPAEFIALAEESGLIVEIGDWVLREAASQAVRWRALDGTGLAISINVSPLQFQKGSDGMSSWMAHLRELDLPGHSLNIEITEGLLLQPSSAIQDRLLEFRTAGVRVSLDDFGTGYSSLAYLKKFHIDYLKIDQSFVRHLAQDSEDMALCEAIIVMAHKLGLKVIAEGVETDQQRALLSAAGCDFAQGYLLSHPLPADEFETKFLSANGELHFEASAVSAGRIAEELQKK